MNDIWIRVHDPVYDLVVFDEPNPRALLERPDGTRKQTTLTGKKIPHVVSAEPKPAWTLLLYSREFRRLQFIRQLPLGWLVFPSATHTRYAHSIGVYALGEMFLAQTMIKTMDAKRSIESFYEWAQDRELYDEFLAALLLHDIGNFPFSHVLEPLFPIITHQELGSALILFDYDELKNTRFRRIYNKYLQEQRLPDIEQGRNAQHGRLLNSILGNHFKTLSRAVVCWLIGGYSKRKLPDGQDQPSFTGITEEFIRNQVKKDRKKGLWKGTFEDLEVLKALVSGLLDFEKFDHYHRHSFFTGIKLANFNFKNFISGATINVPRPKAALVVSLTKTAAGQAIAMLQSRETIRRYLFLRPEAVALEAMFRWAAARHIDISSKNLAEKDDLFLWLLKTDDEVICELRSSDISSIRSMLDMVINVCPYNAYKCGYVKDDPEIDADIKDVQDLNGWLVDLSENAGLNGSDDELPKLIWDLPSAIRDSDEDPGDKWLNLKQLRVRGGRFNTLEINIFNALAQARKRVRIRFNFYVHPRHPKAIEEGDFLEKVKKRIAFD